MGLVFFNYIYFSKNYPQQKIKGTNTFELYHIFHFLMANFFCYWFFWGVILSDCIQTIFYFISFFNNNRVCLFVFLSFFKLVYKLIYDTFLDLSNGIGLKFMLIVNFVIKWKFEMRYLVPKGEKGGESSKVALRQTHKQKGQGEIKMYKPTKKIVHANWDQNCAQTSCKVSFQFTRHSTSQTWKLCTTFPLIIYFMIDGWGCIKVTKKFKIFKKES